ncbi:hypothetical protein GCM10011410_29630 [Hoyosella rhizosphaerae]|uniref:Uncharacterized protein n=1 Tax=Hoyosella rhizosphaerae TaxID=1755582 RepID=A0A916UJJ7_9ACTN|nr:hypothetical protein GCM10011410_29630 [Hoyosella rhizosphaerae]
MAIKAEAYEVASAEGKATVQGLLLRDIPDSRVASACSVAESANVACVDVLEAKQNPEQGRLARPVGPEHGDELTGVDFEGEFVPKLSMPEGQARVPQFHDGICQ